MTHRLAALGPALLLSLLLVAPAQTEPNAVARIYSDEELAHWQQRYPAGVLSNFRNVILKKLPPETAAALKDVRFEFPLRVEKAEPYAFFARGRTITMSIASLKFQDDLAIATAWLNRKGYSPVTVTEYAQMLKYGRFDARPAKPRAALCIPESALDDKDVDTLAQKGLGTTIVFIMLHELGHIFHGHAGYSGISRAQAQRNEAQADAFALDGMARIGDPPLGVVTFFTVVAHMKPNRGDFEKSEAYERQLAGQTHPVDAARLRAFGQNLQKTAQIYAPSLRGQNGTAAYLAVALQVGMIADTLDNRQMQRLIAQIGRSVTLRSLGPRRPQAKLGPPCGAGPSTSDVVFDGLHSGELTISNVKFRIDAWMERRGERVKGIYSYGLGAGQMEGVVEGNRLVYRWSLGSDSGRGVLARQPDGRLAGTWGTGTSTDNGGPWHVRRQK